MIILFFFIWFYFFFEHFYEKLYGVPLGSKVCIFSGTKNNFSGTKNNFSATKNNISGTKNNFSPTKINFSPTNIIFSPTKIIFSGTKINFSPTKINFSHTKNTDFWAYRYASVWKTAMCLFEFSQSKPLLQIDTPMHPSRVKSIVLLEVMEYKSELHTWNHNLPEISINGLKRREKFKFDKGLFFKTRYTNLSNCSLHNFTFRFVFTHSGCLHLSNTPLWVRQKNRAVKLHNGLWCRVCAPYGYVSLSHLGNIVLTNEIATFHNGGISSSNKT